MTALNLDPGKEFRGSSFAAPASWTPNKGYWGRLRDLDRIGSRGGGLAGACIKGSMQKFRLIILSLKSSHISLHWLLRLVLFSTYLAGGNCEYSQNVEHLDLIFGVLVDKSRLTAASRN